MKLTDYLYHTRQAIQSPTDHKLPSPAHLLATIDHAIALGSTSLILIAMACPGTYAFLSRLLLLGSGLWNMILVHCDVAPPK